MHLHLLKLEHFEGMDGAASVLRGQVRDIGNDLESNGYVMAGDGIDAAIAAAVIDSKGDSDELQGHLDYIIKELSRFRTNVRKFTHETV